MLVIRNLANFPPVVPHSKIYFKISEIFSGGAFVETVIPPNSSSETHWLQKIESRENTEGKKKLFAKEMLFSYETRLY